MADLLVIESFTSGDMKSIGIIYRAGDVVPEAKAKQDFSDEYLAMIKRLKFVVEKTSPEEKVIKRGRPLKSAVVIQGGNVVEAPTTPPEVKVAPHSYPVPMAPERENQDKQLKIRVVEEARLPLVTAKEDKSEPKSRKKLPTKKPKK